MAFMATSVFTTRLDTGIKAELERIARYDDRSASYLANQAITALVEERRATRELVTTGLAMIEKGVPGIEAGQVHDFLLAEDDQPFPQPVSVNI